MALTSLYVDVWLFTLASRYLFFTSAAGDGLTNIMENHTFVPRARYLRLLRRRRRYELLYHSVLRLCSEFRESRSFLWHNIKKKHPRQKFKNKKMRGDQARTRLPRVYTRISRLWSSKRQSSSPSCDATKVFTYFPRMFTAVCERSVVDTSLSATNRYLRIPIKSPYVG